VRIASAIVVAVLGAAGTLGWQVMPVAALDDDTRLIALMERMRASTGVFARFTEKKEVALLSEPLLSRGVLFFAPPETLLRLTTAPADVRLLLNGDRVQLRDAAGSDRFDLAANTAASQFVENFLVLFSGNLVELRARYKLEFAINDDDWRLDLRPTRAPFNKLVASVALEGRGEILRTIEIREIDGDSTVTQLSDMDATVEFGPNELFERFADARSSPPD
jgi:hypothetical protein